MDFGRAGGLSMGKQVKLFASALAKAASTRGNAKFTTEELERFARDLRVQVPSFSEFLDVRARASFDWFAHACTVFHAREAWRGTRTLSR